MAANKVHHASKQMIRAVKISCTEGKKEAEGLQGEGSAAASVCLPQGVRDLASSSMTCTAEDGSSRQETVHNSGRGQEGAPGGAKRLGSLGNEAAEGLMHCSQDGGVESSSSGSSSEEDEGGHSDTALRSSSAAPLDKEARKVSVFFPVCG